MAMTSILRHSRGGWLPTFIPLFLTCLLAAGYLVSHASEVAWSGTQGPLPVVAMSPDGTHIASSAGHPGIDLWNPANGTARILGEGSSGTAITALAFTPDGTSLASLDADGVTLWDLESGGERTVFPAPLGDSVRDLAFSLNGELLAARIDDAEVVLWNLSTGATQSLVPPDDTVLGVSLSPDNRTLATYGLSSEIHLWNAADGQQGATLSLHSGSAVTALAFGPTADTLIAADRAGMLTLWNPGRGASRALGAHWDSVQSLTTTQDRKRLASISRDGQIKLWALPAGEELPLAPMDLASGAVGAWFSADGERLAAVAEDNSIAVWDLRTVAAPRLLAGGGDPIVAIAFDNDQATLASLSATGALTTWDLATGTQRDVARVPGFDSATLAGVSVAPAVSSPMRSSAAASPARVAPTAAVAASTPLGGTAASDGLQASTPTARVPRPTRRGPKGITALAVNPTGTAVATSEQGGALRLWTAGLAEKSADKPAKADSPTTGVAFSSDGQGVITAGMDSQIRFWDSRTRTLTRIGRGHEHSVTTLAASPTGNLVASAGQETRIMVWDSDTGRLTQVLNEHSDFVNALAFSSDGKVLASGGADARVLLWSPTTGKLLYTLLGHTEAVNAVAFSRNSAVLASAGADSQIRLWDPKTGQQIAVLAGGQGTVRTLATSPTADLLASAGDDARIFIWNLASRQLLTVLPSGSSTINTLAFLPGGRLLSADEAGQIALWDLASAKQLKAAKPALTPNLAPTPTTADNRAPGAPSTIVTRSVGLLARLAGWLMPAAAADTLPDPTQGPGGPILVVTSPSSIFGTYYAEILRTEGLNEFHVADIGSVTATTLNAYDLVLLAPMTLTMEQVSLFTTWVNDNGGRLIAMRPDPQLAGLLGLTAAGTPLANGYLRVDTSKVPGNGIADQPLQFHGTADRYSLSGASSLATLYSNFTSATTNPAVTLRRVGTGQAATFTYDLATSIVYTRQGNPAWAAQERDGMAPIRSDDKFYGAAASDPQPDWVDLDHEVAVPQADEQQRFLANLIVAMELDKKPLPRFWYFPNGKKAVVVMTGDDHGNGGTAGRFQHYIDISPGGCILTNWECIRSTSYVYVEPQYLTDTQAATYSAQGFEVGLHINTDCADFTAASLNAFYSQQVPDFTATYPSIPAPKTERHHCITWSDWISGAKTQFQYGIRLDTSYYFWPPSWAQNRPGFFTGSAMPMRFADLDGTLIDVYNAATQMTDESGQAYPYTSDALLGAALGATGYYGAYVVNAHTDTVDSSVSDAVVASALNRGVPIVSGVQLLNWLDARNASSFSGLTWGGNTLNFNVNPATGATGLQAMLPTHTAAGTLATVAGPSGSAAYTIDSIKGIEYALFAAAAGSYRATYASDPTPPTVIATSPPNGATAVSVEATVAATFSEAMDPATINSASMILRSSDGTLVPTALSYAAASRSAVMVPNSALAGSTTYTATVKAGLAKDLAGNALAADYAWSFTTGAAINCPCSAWSDATTPANPAFPDSTAVEVGVKFRTDVNGSISGIRFYKGSGNTGTHTGHLWTTAGQLLATANFTSETATGWQMASFASPIAVTANTVYVASYFAPNGNYAIDSSYFANAGVDNVPVHLLRDGVSGGNGVYAYGASSNFPASSYNAANYWVDVVFTPATAPAALSLTGTLPTNGATGVTSGSEGSLITVQAYFNNALDATTVGASTFTLRDGANSLVEAAVSVSGNTATLIPTSPLAAATSYTATLTTGIRGTNGNALGANVTWSFTTAAGPSDCSAPANPIVAENCLVGNPASEWDISGIGDATIQGFTTDISINRGATANFKIKTDAANYRLDIYRMGYYGGAGARKVATVNPSAALPQSQPACVTDTASGLTDCGNWAISASWAVPATATSGIYFARAVRGDTGGASHIVFIVRDDDSHSDLLFQTSDTSWHAYNDAGGKSLYGCNGNTDANCRAYKVSYNRPFNTRVYEPETWVFNAEYPMVRWIEANGYDVSYFSEVDTERQAALIHNHKVWMSNGHDEYWSAGQRASVQAARDAGVHLAFFSGNTMFWKTRWENAIDGTNTPYRTLVCYKETHANDKIDPLDPPTWTGTWRDPRFSPPADGGQPENELAGTLFRMNGGQNGTITVPQADGRMRFWRNTPVAALGAGQVATLAPGTIGAEFDDDEDNGVRPAGLFGLSNTSFTDPVNYLLDYGSTYGAGTAVHKITLYRAASGALVFKTGTYQWSWGLDNNHDRSGLGATTNGAMQQATVNLFADMGIQPATLQTGLSSAVASADTQAPSTTISSPAAGSTVPQGIAVTVSGTATDTGGGVVAGTEVSVDGGATWHPASGREAWSYTWTPNTSGSVTIKSRAVDDSGNLQTPGTGVTVTVVGCTGACTIWPSAATPGTSDAGADSPVELGVKFKSDLAGTITGIRFYKGSGNIGAHVGNLWSSTGQLLASATFSGETASGWQQVTLSTPVSIAANTVYVASYHTNPGHYAADKNYFVTTGVDNQPLHALQTGVSGGNGVFAYGSASAFPNQTWNASNYWVDVVFSGSPPPTLQSLAVTPSSPSVLVGSPVQLTATGTYSDASSRDLTGQVAWSSSNPSVASVSAAGLASGVSAGTATLSAVLNGVSASTQLTVQAAPLTIATASLPGATVTLPYTTTLAATGGTLPYTWSITAGTLPGGLTLNATSGVISGTPTTAGTAGFTVGLADGSTPAGSVTKVLGIAVAAVPTGLSIWPSTAAPVAADGGPDSAVELGLKFRADVAGTITGIRFYKASANTGPHVANLWSNVGALLGTASFTAETGSGWQTATFSTPVSITAGTVYVASYHCNSGHYSADTQYFASTGVDNAPLHALANGVSGGNGVFAYGSASAFPNQTWNAANYWVDVAFNPAP